ncbi:MAG: type II toxin-antitoxin system RelE/ParE family toxin [Kiritimatiellia bacterium]|jgi:mRNA interferase RelE/StbE|nr:type II toxin-antitoxin system RelE/ParE family toxin [Kiritimatiellia bacterium]MDP6847975.1 type II toxin-antitoxin system RelE/ParE family toxin [Kiritimatiellia bacterium]
MEPYRLVVKQSVSKDLKKIPKKDVKRILAAIRALAANPRPPQSKKLSGQDRYRLRQENYRILYAVEDDRLVVCVVKVGDRRSVYQ